MTEPLPLKPWPIFWVSDLHGQFPGRAYTAPTRDKARWSVFTDLREPYPDATFPEFLRRFRFERLTDTGYLDGAYAYVRKAYGLDVAIGQTFTIRGKRGVIVYPNRDTTSQLHIGLEGVGHSLLYHPLDLDNASRGAAA